MINQLVTSEVAYRIIMGWWMMFMLHLQHRIKKGTKREWHKKSDLGRIKRAVGKRRAIHGREKLRKSFATNKRNYRSYDARDT